MQESIWKYEEDMIAKEQETALAAGELMYGAPTYEGYGASPAPMTDPKSGAQYNTLDQAPQFETRGGGAEWENLPPEYQEMMRNVTPETWQYLAPMVGQAATPDTFNIDQLAIVKAISEADGDLASLGADFKTEIGMAEGGLDLDAVFDPQRPGAMRGFTLGQEALAAGGNQSAINAALADIATIESDSERNDAMDSFQRVMQFQLPTYRGGQPGDMDMGQAVEQERDRLAMERLVRSEMPYESFGGTLSAYNEMVATEAAIRLYDRRMAMDEWENGGQAEYETNLENWRMMHESIGYPVSDVPPPDFSIPEPAPAAETLSLEEQMTAVFNGWHESMMDENGELKDEYFDAADAARAAGVNLIEYVWILSGG